MLKLIQTSVSLTAVVLFVGISTNAFAFPGQACAADSDCSGFGGFPETCQNGACHGPAGFQPGLNNIFAKATAAVKSDQLRTPPQAPSQVQ